VRRGVSGVSSRSKLFASGTTVVLGGLRVNKTGYKFQASSDHEIAKITEMGFRADEAATALRLHNGNVQQAIDYLLTRKKPGGPNRQSSYESDRGGDRGRGRRDRRDDDGGGGGRLQASIFELVLY